MKQITESSQKDRRSVSHSSCEQWYLFCGDGIHMLVEQQFYTARLNAQIKPVKGNNSRNWDVYIILKLNK